MATFANGVTTWRSVREMFHSLWRDYPPEVPITAVLMVSMRVVVLLNQLKELYDRYLGPNWSSAPVITHCGNA